jgi:DNA polymerase-3 subunit beta
MEAVLDLNAVTAPAKPGSLKATVALGHLQHALRVVTPAIPSHTTIPILAAVCIEQLPSGLAVSAADLTVAIRALIPENTALTRALAIPSHPLLKWVGLLEDKDSATVAFAATDRRVNIHCGRSKAAVCRMPAQNVPARQFEMETEKLTFKQAELRRVLSFTLFCVGDNDRMQLDGVQLTAGGGKLRAVSTDGARMAIYTLPSNATIKDLLLPEKMLKALMPVLADDEEALVTVQERGSFLLATVAADIPVAVNSGKITAAFPKWEAVFPKNTGHKVFFSAPELLASIARCVSMGDRDTRAIKLVFSKHEIAVTSSDQGGESFEAVRIDDGPETDVSVGVNGGYLKDALRKLDGEASLALPAMPRSPILLSAAPKEGEQFDYILMPLNLQEK